MRALLVIDVQNDFCPGGKLAVPNGDEVVPLINELSTEFDHLFFTQDWHPGRHASFASSHDGKQPYDTINLAYGEQILWPDHCVQGSTGAEFHPDLNVDAAELIIRKGFRREIDSYSAFFENDQETRTGLSGFLREREIETLYLVGLATDFCVHWSAVDGRNEGFDIFVVEDATRGIDQDGSLERAMTRMREAGAGIISSDEVTATVRA